ncbi:T-cell surface glycoprotein CD3 epsilon chain [Collichthys lucidus]|uniref:T-cell surface glycoprotein CD3 epsilon chain n=1 Tax=Collichthys lucidus TaxID=240159 RepID=A0A4U5V2F9_COLLU|nr:T-cell surface glycoprotein CD3 epsilon chain [Collichthys lucidus]
MTSMASQAPFVVVLLLLFLATVKAQTNKGGVTFLRKDFTMTCPEAGTWYYKHEKTTDPVKSRLTITYGNDKKGLYHCEYDSDSDMKKYYFFVQGKVCENCFELDAFLFGVVIVMDVALTAVVMIIIFMCTKKKNPAGLAHPPKSKNALKQITKKQRITPLYMLI